MNLQIPLNAHKLRRKLDKRNIMTMVMKKAERNHPSRSFDDNHVVVVDRKTKQLLLFETLSTNEV